MRHRTRMAGLVLGLATTGALIAAGLAGCGGSGATANGATPAAVPSGQQELQAYVTCLRQHGANIELPSGRPSGFPSRAGGSGRPTARPSGDRSRGPGGFGGGGNGGGGFGGNGGGFGSIFGDNGQPPAGVDQATWDAAQQACASVRPSFGAGAARDNGAAAAYLNCLRDHGLVASGGPTRLNTADPAAAAAIQACAALRPSFGAAPSPTG